MKTNVKKILPLLILTAIPIGLFLLQKNGGFLAGSRVDWISQHTVLPEYFRTKFYETGNFFPQYAAELGGGQNIYNFAYYGLYHPLYLFSYLLPFVKMQDYIQGLMLTLWCADGILAYLWLGCHVRKKFAFFGAMEVPLAVPLVYHSSGQIMFVSYLPFLLILFLSYETKHVKKRFAGSVLGTLGMILSSFYFSVGGFLAFTVYVFADSRKKQSVLGIFKHLTGSFLPILSGVLLSAFYLLPVYEAMKGRSGNTKLWQLKELLIPDFSVNNLLYSPYGIGVTFLAILTVCTMVFMNKSREQLLAGILLFCCECPLIRLLLNGGLYIRGKALIPFLLLFCLLTAEFLQKLVDGKIGKGKLGMGILITIFLLGKGMPSISDPEKQFLLFDGIMCLLAVLLLKIGWKYLPYLMMLGILCSVSVFSVLQMKSLLVTKAQMKELENPEITGLVKKYQNDAESNYRIEVRGTGQFNRDCQNRIWSEGQMLTTGYSSFYNAEYQKLRSDLGLNKTTRNILMQDMTDNPLFLQFMGVKYLVGKVNIPEYRKIETKPSAAVYQNNDAAPVAYLTNQSISQKQFRELLWPEKQLALQQSAVVGKANGKTSLKLMEIPITILPFSEDNKRSKSNPTIEINSQKELYGKALWDRPAGKGSYLFLSFEVKNKNKNEDISISIQGTKNKLSSENSLYYNQNETFHYTIPLNENARDVEIQFGKGKYKLCNIHAWLGSIDKEMNQKLWNQPAQISQDDQGNGFTGHFDAAENSWLITSIPYDENFRLYIDGKKVQKQRVNQAFIGAEVKAGKHIFQLEYKSKGSFAGRCLTAAGCIFLWLLWKKRHSFQAWL